MKVVVTPERMDNFVVIQEPTKKNKCVKHVKISLSFLTIEKYPYTHEYKEVSEKYVNNYLIFGASSFVLIYSEKIL